MIKIRKSWRKSVKRAARQERRNAPAKFPNPKSIFPIVLVFVVLGIGAGVGIFFFLQHYADKSEKTSN